MYGNVARCLLEPTAFGNSSFAASLESLAQPEAKVPAAEQIVFRRRVSSEAACPVSNADSSTEAAPSPPETLWIICLERNQLEHGAVSARLVAQEFGYKTSRVMLPPQQKQLKADHTVAGGRVL